MSANVFVIHTSSVSVQELTGLFRELAPEVTVRNIIDDSLLPEVLAHGGVTEGVRKRIAQYVVIAQEAGADVILNQCSSVGEAALEAARLVTIPVVRIDEPMARVACETGGRIGVIATLRTTLGPTCRLIASTAHGLGKTVQIVERLCEGAFEKLVAGDRAAHNRMVIEAIHRLVEEVDVVVCAQGSMTALLPDLGVTSVPVLTSPRLGVQETLDRLRSR